MDQLSPNLISQLLEPQTRGCVSLYMPTFKTSPDSLQNPIRFENLIKQAKDLLDSSPHVTHQLKNQLAQAASRVQDDDFWQHQSHGLAVFISQDQLLFLRLPLKFKEFVSVNHHCHFKPLLPLLTTNGKFHILTLSQNDIKLYEATRTDVDKIFLGDIPRSLEELVDPDDLRQHLQFHTQSSSRGNKSTMYHGQGGSGDKNLKSQVEEFIQLVAKGVDDLLEGDKSPLILAGVEYLVSMYRKHSSHTQITDKFIEGSPDQTTKQKLHQEAWKIVRPIFKQAEKQALDQYHAKAGTGQTAANLPEVLLAAVGGRIDSLFVLRDHQIWGTFDVHKNQVHLDKTQTPKNEDLLDFATIKTLQASGQVFSLKPHEMPKGAPHLAALFRY